LCDAEAFVKISILILATVLTCGVASAAEAAERYSFSGTASYQTNVAGNTGGYYDVTFTSASVPQSGGPGYTYVYDLTGTATFTPFFPSQSNPVVSGTLTDIYTLVLRQDATTPAYYVDLFDSSASILWSITGSASDVVMLDLTRPGSATPPTNIIDQNFIDFTNGGYGLIEVPQSYLTFTIADIPAAVPEPASWALMVGGFGLAGATLRRRRSQALARG